MTAIGVFNCITRINNSIIQLSLDQSNILFIDKGSKVDECRYLELFMVGNKERALTDAGGLRHSSGWAKKKVTGLESNVEYGVMT